MDSIFLFYIAFTQHERSPRKCFAFPQCSFDSLNKISYECNAIVQPENIVLGLSFAFLQPKTKKQNLLQVRVLFFHFILLLYSTNAHLENTACFLAVGLAPYKSTTINAPTSKLVERYYHTFARLVAYAKYLFNKPSNALPCLASSLPISCTVS